MYKKVLTIAGFDGSGGAGIQADIKVCCAFGCYAMSVLTALPIQNTQGVKYCHQLPGSLVLDQLETIFEDIRPDVIKIGMLYNEEVITIVSEFLCLHAAVIPIVVDPVMIAKSGAPLLLSDAIECLRNKLIPLASIVLPNLLELEALANQKVKTVEDMPLAAKAILDLGAKTVLAKGGHLQGDEALDLFIDRFCNSEWLQTAKIATRNTHGTGCTLSTAVAACLAQGYDELMSCKLAKTYLFNAIDAGKDSHMGQGYGPVHHFYHLWPSLAPLEKSLSKTESLVGEV